MTADTAPVARPLSSFGAPQPGSSGTLAQRSSGGISQLPAFQPAQRSSPKDDGPPKQARRKEPQVKDDGPPKQDDDSPKPDTSDQCGALLLNLLGAFLLVLIVLTPIWDATRLLYSSTFVYFMGRADCVWIIAFCCGAVAFFIIVMMITQVLDRQGEKTFQKSLYLFTLVVTILGLGMLLLSVPMHASAQSTYNELLANCNTGPRTEPLHAYYNVLLTLRLKPHCINKQSVEQCSGFEEHYPYTGFLKHMELGYLCSGFCYQASPHNLSMMTSHPLSAALMQRASAKEEASDDFMGLLQAMGMSIDLPVSLARLQQGEEPRSLGAEALGAVPIGNDVVQRRSVRQHVPAVPADWHQHHKDIQGLFLLAADRNLSKYNPVWHERPQGFGDTIQNMAATGWMKDYPPTLFTNANYKSTCEGAAAREIRFGAQEVSFLMYLEGGALLLASVIVGFMRLFAQCRIGEKEIEGIAESQPTASDSVGGVQYKRSPKKVVL